MNTVPDSALSCRALVSAAIVHELLESARVEQILWKYFELLKLARPRARGRVRRRMLMPGEFLIMATWLDV